MSVVSILSEVLDNRKGSNLSKFNGYLEDFLNSDAPISDEVKVTLTKVLEEDGFEIVAVHDTSSAISLLSQRKFSLVISDLYIAF